LLPGSPADVDPQKYGQQRIPECGPQDKPRDAVDELLLQDAFNLQKPILGICYGAQSLNVWRGGTLIQHLPGFHPKDFEKRVPANMHVDHSPEDKRADAHIVVLAAASRLLEAVTAATDLRYSDGAVLLSVNSSHHQALQEIGDQLVVAARSDADGVVEAVEGTDPRQLVWGIQWHPERSYDSSPASRILFDFFVREAGAWHLPSIRESVAR
jgi:putative glutamine amidotransferase